MSDSDVERYLHTNAKCPLTGSLYIVPNLIEVEYNGEKKRVKDYDNGAIYLVCPEFSTKDKKEYRRVDVTSDYDVGRRNRTGYGKRWYVIETLTGEKRTPLEKWLNWYIPYQDGVQDDKKVTYRDTLVDIAHNKRPDKVLSMDQLLKSRKWAENPGAHKFKDG